MARKRKARQAAGRSAKGSEAHDQDVEDSPNAFYQVAFGPDDFARFSYYVAGASEGGPPGELGSSAMPGETLYRHESTNVGGVVALSLLLEAMHVHSATAETSPLALASSDPRVTAAIFAVLLRVPEIVHARQEALSQDNIDFLVDAYLKSAPTAPARHEIEMDNARERARFVEEFPCYSSREVAGLAGHEAANASATATRWKKARRIIGLPWKGSDLYPAFQFREGRPRPIVGRLIEILPERMSPWQIAFWLTSSNSWLGGATPLERLDDEVALLAAATRESEALGG